MYDSAITTPTGKIAVIAPAGYLHAGTALEPFKGRAVTGMIGPRIAFDIYRRLSLPGGIV